MKALVLEDFGRMVVQEHRKPEPTGEEVLIEIVATGICGSDIHGYTGENGRRVPGQIMGHETVGIVAECGPEAASHGFAPGDVVTFNPVVVPAGDADRYAGREQHCPNKYVIGVAHDVVAAFAQFVTVPARNVVRLRNDMPIEYGALIEPIAVGVHAVRRVGVNPTSTVLVLGGGPIGQAVVLAARMEGASHIVVSEIDPGRRALCERTGCASDRPDHRPGRGTGPQYLRRTREHRARRGGHRAHRRVGARVRAVGRGGVPGRHGRAAVPAGRVPRSAPRSGRSSAASPTRPRTSATPRSGCPPHRPRSPS